MHYPSDVLAGALLGVALGLIVPALTMKVGNRRAAQCRQVDALQRADQGRRPDRAITRSRRSSPTSRSPRFQTSGSSGWPRRCEAPSWSPATISFHDIAGLVKGASEGEGLGNRFLASIRETDAICHVVRCHAATRGVPHPDGRVDPLADIETIETELVLSDFEQVERRLDRVGKQAKSGDAGGDRRARLAASRPRGDRRGPAGSLGPGSRCRARRRRNCCRRSPQADPLRRQRR